MQTDTKMKINCRIKSFIQNFKGNKTFTNGVSFEKY